MSPYFYSVAHAQGRDLLAELFKTEDPYGLPPAEIVERFLALGCTPVVSSMQREPFPQFGVTADAQLDGSTFFVAISRDAETIGVQEVRLDPYPSE